MEKILKDKVELTVKNYRTAKEILRNDGDILNHFGSLVYAHYEKEIPIAKVKEIRKYIKSTSSRVSPFRGDILYILSLLIAIEEERELEIIDRMYKVMSLLTEGGFKECDHLALASFVIVKYDKNNRENEIVQKMKEVYQLLKTKYKNITQEDDYLVCALWALNDIDVDTLNEFIEAIYEQMSELKINSKNSIQGLANAVMLNESSGHMYRTMEFIMQLEKRGLKIANQFFPLLGVLINITPRRVADLVEDVIEELCDEEYEYEYYMDKGFRTIIATSIVAFCTQSANKRYIDELLAHGIYCFIKSKNTSLLTEILA